MMHFHLRQRCSLSKGLSVYLVLHGVAIPYLAYTGISRPTRYDFQGLVS